MRKRNSTIVWAVIIFALCDRGCINPFAPRLDTSPAAAVCDPHSIEGLFECFQAAYSFRDTTVYSPLIHPDFVFIYRDYNASGGVVDITWGRDEELRTTFGLFQNTQKLDLIWNNIISTSAESTTVNVVRGFNLTVVFNPSDIERVDGYANITFERDRASDPWRIIRWRDESNF